MTKLYLSVSLVLFVSIKVRFKINRLPYIEDNEIDLG